MNPIKYDYLRDGYPSDWEDVFLCAGATEGIRVCLKMISNSGVNFVTYDKFHDILWQRYWILVNL